MTFEIPAVGMSSLACNATDPGGCKSSRYQAPIGAYDPALVQDSLSFSSQGDAVSKKSNMFSIGGLLSAIGGAMLGRKIMGGIAQKVKPGVRPHMGLLGTVSGAFAGGSLFRMFQGKAEG